MFGTTQRNLVIGLHRVQQYICCYVPGTFCDCKFGIPESWQTGEQTGCPEVRCATELINAMSPEEFKDLCERAFINVTFSSDSQ